MITLFLDLIGHPSAIFTFSPFLSKWGMFACNFKKEFFPAFPRLVWVIERRKITEASLNSLWNRKALKCLNFLVSINLGVSF